MSVFFEKASWMEAGYVLTGRVRGLFVFGSPRIALKCAPGPP